MTDPTNPKPSADHERIWLQPSGDEGIDDEMGRLWCKDPVWDEGTEYVRADLFAELEARNVESHRLGLEWVKRHAEAQEEFIRSENLRRHADGQVAELEAKLALYESVAAPTYKEACAMADSAGLDVERAIARAEWADWKVRDCNENHVERRAWEQQRDLIAEMETENSRLETESYGLSAEISALETAECPDCSRLVDRIAELEAKQVVSCVVCSATLLPREEPPPHCHGCLPTEEQEEEWYAARRAEEKSDD